MQTLRDYALEVCTKAARNIGGTIREVAKRTKSQAYLFGALRRRFPEATEEEFRATLHWLRHNAPDEDFTTEPRAPTKGREASSEPCWGSRAAQLANVVECSSPAELLDIAHQRLGWSRNFTIQTLAAAEDAGLLTYEAFCWRTNDAVTKTAIKKIRIERTLPCKLSPEQSHQAAQAAAAKLLERERLETELKNLIREKRAEIANCQKEFIRLVVASGQAIEERSVECEQKTNYKLGVVEVTRLDTGEIVEARELRADEKQLELGATG
jgi:hypothetical protein